MIPITLIMFSLAKADGSWSLRQDKLYCLSTDFGSRWVTCDAYWGSTTCHCSKPNVRKLASSTTIQHTEDQPEAKGYDPQHHNMLWNRWLHIYVCVEIQFLFQNASTRIVKPKNTYIVRTFFCVKKPPKKLHKFQ